MSFHELTFTLNVYFNSLGIEFMLILQRSLEFLKQAPSAAYLCLDAHHRNLDNSSIGRRCRANEYQPGGLLWPFEQEIDSSV